MKLPTIFKQRSNKTYNYTPRYYDERKERIAELEKKHHSNKNENTIKSHRKRSYRDEWLKTRKSSPNKKSNLRLFLILIALFMLAYVLLKRFNLDTLAF